ncbi:multidrug resistance-associated protein 5 [Tanacetum coccineum]
MVKRLFEVDRGCEAIQNSFSECFNSVIVTVRHKPLLTMLEAIIVIVLERMNKIREISRKWNLGVCPNIKKRLEWLKEQQRFWHVIPAGGNRFEVRLGSEGFTINEGKRSCSCRMWQLSGIPCVHATNVIFLKYRSMYSTVLPPKPKNACCKEPILEQTPKPKGGSGRPKKNQSFVNLEDADVGVRGPVRDEGASRSRKGVYGSQQGSEVKGGLKGGACGSKQSSAGAGGSKGGAGASGSKRKAMSSAVTQKIQGKKKVETSGFDKWFGLQDEPEQTQDVLVQTQDELVQTQDEDQVEQTQEQAKIDVTQVEQTQEKT